MTLDAISSAWKIVAGLKARDIQATAKFYAEELHFTVSKPYQDSEASEPTFVSVSAGHKAAANLYYSKLGSCGGGSEGSFPAGEAYIALGTEELDRFYNALVEMGHVRVVEEVEDKPWGYRQFTIADPDGNRLTFFRFLEGGNPGME